MFLNKIFGKPKNIFKAVFGFLKEIRLELKKITWLSKKEVLQYTLIVIGVAVIVAAFLGSIDFLFTTFLNKFIL